MSQSRWRIQTWGVMFALIGGAACEEDDAAQDTQSSSEQEQSGASGAASGGHSDAQHHSGDGADADDDASEADSDDEQTSKEGAEDAPVVEVASGKLEGAWIHDGAVRSFLGVPYAKPPVGELRWQPPQKPESWKDTRSATEYGGRCAQLESTTLMNAASDNEDCLYLNVWAPKAADRDNLLPVMFWIHGGGNVNGSASEPVPYADSGYFYTGENLADEQDVVVVSLNYRLGVFGFLAHAGLSDEGSRSGNQGLWDQVFALEWVRDNIEAFGGDPDLVTIFGESAGSFDVCGHVASPETRGLFAQAISQSGGCTTLQPTRVEAEAAADELAKQVDCDQADDVLGCLRDKSVDELLMAASKLSTRFAPHVDGAFWPEQPRDLFDSGDVADVPYVLGSNTDEGTLFTLNAMIDSEQELEAALKPLVDAPLEQVLEHYPLSEFEHEDKPYQAALARIVGDARLVCSTYDSAVRYAQTGAPTYMYNFDIPANIPGLGATHGSELVYVFGSSSNLSKDQEAAAKRIRTYWANLAKHGDPNGDDLKEWPEFGEQDVRLNFALETSVVHDFRASQCEFWRGIYDAQFEAADASD